MKKSLISLVAAAALVGGTMAVATPSFAGTVNAGGGTNVSMYGFIRTYTQWDKKAGLDGLVADTTANPKAAWSGFDLTQTRIGFKLNSGNGVSGKIEGDFNAGGKFRLRHAYVKQDLGGGAWLLVGQTWPIGFVGATFSNTLNWDVQPGMLGAAVRRGQVQLGSTFAFGSGSLTAVGELEDFSNYVEGTTVARKTSPGFGGKLQAKINTGFGSPATLYGLVFGQSLKITDPTTSTESSKTPYAFSAGAAIPLSMVTLKTNFDYAKGATNFLGFGVAGSPDSYYTNSGTTKATTATAWNLEADIAATKDVGFALGYFTAKFKKAAVVAQGTGTVRKTATVFAQVNYKTSKATQVAFEWDHLKTKRYNGTTYYSDKGNQEFVTYQYNF